MYFPPQMNLSDIGLSTDKLLDLQVKADNDKQGNLPFYDCPVCKNKGRVFFINENHTEAVRDCECKAIRESYGRIAQSGLQDELKNKSFGNYICKYPFQAECKAKALKFLSGDAGPFFYIGGQSGAGKTHLCTAISGRLLERGYALKYMKWAADAAKILSLSANEDREKKEAVLKRIKEVPVLYIDDFLRSKSPSQAEIRLAFEIIDYRYVNAMKTIISSEKTLNDLFNTDEAIAGRIYERTDKSDCNITIDKKAEYNFRAYKL